MTFEKKTANYYGSSEKKNSKSFKNNNNNGGNKKYKPHTEKKAPVNIDIKLGNSKFYEGVLIPSLIDTIDECSFDKCSIQVKIAKTLLYNNPEAKGSIDFGNIVKFKGTTFTVSVSDYVIEKINEIKDDLVIVPRCRKNADGEIDYIVSFNIVKGDPIDLGITEDDFESLNTEDEEEK